MTNIESTLRSLESSGVGVYVERILEFPRGLTTVDAEFRDHIRGWDRCEGCGVMALLAYIYDRDLEDKLLELYDEDKGAPRLVCHACWLEKGSKAILL